MTPTNEKLSGLLHMIAGMYRLKENNAFRAIAYQNASNSIAGLPEDISYYVKTDSLDQIPGVGKSIGEDIREFLVKGKVKRFDQLKREVPSGLVELMDISGFGPKSLNTIHRKLKLETRDEVIGALQDGSIAGIRGFGPKKVENMLRALKVHKIIEDRMLLWDAMNMGNQLLEKLRSLPGVKNAELAGSLRRRKETVGDIDILVTCQPHDRSAIVRFFTSRTLASKVLAKGETRASIILKSEKRQADLRIVNEKEWGSALVYFTGSKRHNIHLRSIARDRGMKISEYGVFSIKEDKWLAGRTEDKVYGKLKMDWIPPEMREDRGEIEMAMHHRMPKLIEVSDLQGDLQMHSKWSDGVQSISDINQYIKSHFQYNYFAVTDHSLSSRIAGGLKAAEFRKQILEIRELNQSNKSGFIKTGVEVDILQDGLLDLDDELLADMDWVTASIHAGFAKDATERLIRATGNPNVHCIGHPMGRLIGKRAPYPADWDAVIKSCRVTGTALEINAQPERMDISDELAIKAKEAGVKVVISTDAHQPAQLHFMQLGVSVARRAGLTKEDIVNAWSWPEVQRYFRRAGKHSGISSTR